MRSTSWSMKSGEHRPVRCPVPQQTALFRAHTNGPFQLQPHIKESTWLSVARRVLSLLLTSFIVPNSMSVIFTLTGLNYFIRFQIFELHFFALSAFVQSFHINTQNFFAYSCKMLPFRALLKVGKLYANCRLSSTNRIVTLISFSWCVDVILHIVFCSVKMLT